MIVIGFWLGCATFQHKMKNSNGDEPLVLESIDLRKEFGSEAEGWIYHLKKQEIPPNQKVALPDLAGWAAMDESNKLLGTGFYPDSSPSILCSQGCLLLYTEIEQTDRLLIMPVQNDLQFRESAPEKSSGLSMLETWSKPLTVLPVDNKSLRMRLVQLEPLGNVGQHKHNGRPSFAYIVSGDVQEHRGIGHQGEDRVYSEGERVAERNGLVHWWENGSEEATIIVFKYIDSK